MRLNNDNRIDWINNDEKLYLWWRSEKIGIYKFIKNNKKELDIYIKTKLEENS